MAKNKNKEISVGSKMKHSWDNRLFEIINAVMLILVFIVTIYPLWFVILASISDPQAVANGEVILLPVGFSTDAYKRVFENADVWIGYLNTIFYTVVGTILNVVVTVLMGYATSRKDLPGRNIIMTMLIITMYFGGGLIPGYLNVKSLGLVDTRAAMVILGLIGPSNVIICRTFFQNSIPWEMQEAAFIDGASDAYVFRKVVMPLSRAILSVLAIYYAVGHWNSYFNAMIYLKDESKFPLQIFLRKILIMGEAESLSNVTGQEELAALIKEMNIASQMKYALIIVASVPILAIYPWFEKYFEKGVMIGGIKG